MNPHDVQIHCCVPAAWVSVSLTAREAYRERMSRRQRAERGRAGLRWALRGGTSRLSAAVTSSWPPEIEESTRPPRRADATSARRSCGPEASGRAAASSAAAPDTWAAEKEVPELLV